MERDACCKYLPVGEDTDMAVRILTDSASDLSQEYAKKHGIEVIPLRVRFGETEYLDGVTITPEDFFRELEKKVLPKTSQITPYQYDELFRAAADAGDEVVCICMSSGVSGTWQNACMAAEEYEGKVFVIDSKQFCISEGILALEAARMRDEGMNAREIAEKLEEDKGHAHVMSVFETLEYLRLGGRMTAAAAWVGGVLNLKPVLTIDEGVVHVLAKARGMKNGNMLMRKLSEKVGGIDWNRPVLLGYTGVSDSRRREYIEDCIASYGEKIKNLPIAKVGACIGTYAGPGAIAIAFFDKN